MSKKLPDFPDALDESSLDEYGVWVKAGPDDSTNETDGYVADLLDDSLDDLPADEQGPGLSLSLDGDMILQEPETGSLPGAGITLKGQEVADMSEQDKKTHASLTESPDDQDFSLDAADELALSNDDDELGSLSDLLMNIDDESEQDDTIYLEDDDLSFDLDEENEDLLLEQEAIDTQGADDFGEDIVIPGLNDELNIESETGGINMPSDSLEGLDDFDSELSSLDSVLAEPDVPKHQDDHIEIHGVEEVGLDEFLDEQLAQGSQKSTENLFESDIPSLDDEISFDMEDSELDLTSEPINEIELEEDGSAEVHSIKNNSLDSDDGMDIDLGPEIDLDEDLIESELGYSNDASTVRFPGSEHELDTAQNTPDSSSQELPELEPESMSAKIRSSGFDDIAAVTAELAMPQSRGNDTSSSKILSSIEDELHAIRSELTDLRAELKKLRTRDQGTNSTPESSDIEILPENKPVDLEFETEAESDAREALAASGGFFDDDEDETIALTGDELDNILNTAEFTEEAGEPSSPDLDEEGLVISDEEELVVPVSAQEFTFSDSVETDSAEAGANESAAYEDTSGSDDFAPIEEISLEEMEPTDQFEASEPAADVFGGSETAMEQLAQLDIEKELAGIEDLKDEDDDIELYTGGELDSLELEIPEDFSKASTIDNYGNSDDADSGIEGLEEELEMLPEQPKAANIPMLDSDSESNSAEEISYNLKQEIKAVLAYMDQLLESLPEEKIEEFARSEHFDVYRKLFDELGL